MRFMVQTVIYCTAVEDTFSFLSQRDISGTFRLPYTTKKIMIIKFKVKIIIAEDGTAMI